MIANLTTGQNSLRQRQARTSLPTGAFRRYSARKDVGKLKEQTEAFSYGNDRLADGMNRLEGQMRHEMRRVAQLAETSRSGEHLEHLCTRFDEQLSELRSRSDRLEEILQDAAHGSSARRLREAMTRLREALEPLTEDSEARSGKSTRVAVAPGLEVRARGLGTDNAHLLEELALIGQKRRTSSPKSVARLWPTQVISSGRECSGMRMVGKTWRYAIPVRYTVCAPMLNRALNPQAVLETGALPIELLPCAGRVCSLASFPRRARAARSMLDRSPSG